MKIAANLTFRFELNLLVKDLNDTVTRLRKTIINQKYTNNINMKKVLYVTKNDPKVMKYIFPKQTQDSIKNIKC